MQFFSQHSKLWQIDSSVQIKMFNLTALGIFLYLHLYYLSFFTEKVAGIGSSNPATRVRIKRL